MNVKFFIDRPVLSSVISIFIVILGIVGVETLPIERFPNIAPPTIMVEAYYTGASAESVQKSVVAPLEQAINGVEDMMYMTSSASNAGSATINVYFKQGTNADMAAVNVQNAVATATGLLPSEVTKIGVTTLKRQSSFLRTFSLVSTDNKYDDNFLTNYLNINIIPNLKRISGIGQVFVMGGDYSMRIWLKPEQMERYHLIPSDITGILAEQNIEAATGAFGDNSDNTFQYTMKYKGRLVEAKEFEDIVIKSNPDGSVLKLKDVARVELGKVSYAFKGNTDGYNGTPVMVFQLAGSNASEVNNQISDYFDEIKPDLPPGVEIVSLMNTNDFLNASMETVVETLLIAILLVIFVVYFFLQDFRSTLIPIVAIIVSLVGTFSFLSLLGFSLNLLTLFALVLVIGTVVDDAIVVVEAVQARFDEGYKSPYKASVDAMKTLVSPIVSTSLVFMAVFIPVSFMPGTSGTFYQQFGLTMALAVAISLLNALTLSPALCAIVLRPAKERKDGKKTFADRMRTAYFATYDVLLAKYKNNVLYMVHHKIIAGAALVVAIVGLVWLMNNTQTGFVPSEDQGIIMVNVNSAPGSTLANTDKVMTEVENRIKNIPEIEHYFKVAGYGLLAGQGNSYGMFILKLKDWDLRKDKSQSSQAVLGKIYGATHDIKDAQVFALEPGMIPGYGMGNSVEMYMLDKKGGTIEDLFNNTQAYAAALNSRPEIGMAFSSFDIRYPQYRVEVDAAKCKRAGLSPREVLGVLGGYYGGIYASNFNRFTKVYRVMIQADSKDRLDKKSLDKIFVRNGSKMAPISQFVKLTRVYGSEVLNRFNMYPSIALNVQIASGYSSGDAIAAIKEVAKEKLPRGYSYDFGGISREEEGTSSNSTAIIFAISVLFIYLIMSALYESFFIPFAVLLAVPFGLLGSFLFANWMGLENNIYLQTGLIMLIGLISKTAILLTEYATERRRAGMTLTQAAYSAAAARLRPILMTALTMVFGMLPLMFATGVGAHGNSSLGTGVVGGMVIGTVAMLLFVPVFFVVFEYIQEKFVPLKKEEITDPRILQEMKEIDEHYKKQKIEGENK